MPTRSSATSVLRWPDRTTVHEALRKTAADLAAANPGITRVGYFGSYASGDWGVGSDLDVIVEVEASGLPFERRATAFDLTGLPVAADVVVYTAEELRQQLGSGSRFARVLASTVWVYARDSAAN